MEDLFVITALNHSGSFGKNFNKFKFKEKNKIVITSLGQSALGKIVPSVLSVVFPNTDLPADENIYFILLTNIYDGFFVLKTIHNHVLELLLLKVANLVVSSDTHDKAIHYPA